MLYLRLLRQTLFPGARTGPRTLRRGLALLLFVPLFLLVQTVHWVFLLLDEIFFPGYRKVEVREPVFIVGLPRSGTSFLQRVLADDTRRFTATRLWELVLAPSILQRRFWMGLAWLDRGIGRPAGRLVAWAQRRGLGFMDAVHKVKLGDPEEDYLLLLPAFACFLLVIPFPWHPAVWDLARFDHWDPRDRDPILRFYRRLVQRHLYVAGPEHQLLSKNPSFTPMIASLAAAFPGSRIIGCLRDPLEAVPSQLSALREGARGFGYDVSDPETADRFVELLASYARHMEEVLPGLPAGRHAFVPMPALGADLESTVLGLYERFGWVPDADFRTRLSVRGEKARAYRSAHEYSLEEFGLSEDEVAERFPDLDELADPGRDIDQRVDPVRDLDELAGTEPTSP